MVLGGACPSEPPWDHSAASQFHIGKEGGAAPEGCLRTHPARHAVWSERSTGPLRLPGTEPALQASARARVSLPPAWRSEWSPQALCPHPSPLLSAAAWARLCQDDSSPRCLRHGCPARAGVRAACLLVGGAAAGPTLGYMVTSATAGQPGDSPRPDFKELGYHPSAYDSDSPYEALDFEGLDQDFDALDLGGFAF